MRRWGVLFGTVAVLSVCAGSAPVVAEPTARDTLKADLDEILADERLAGSSAGVEVRDPASDEVLYSRQGEARGIPASNAKLLTSAAALESLGPDFRFHTEVSTTAEVDGDTLRGDVFLRGTGDPTMLADDYDSFAARIAESGVKRIDGRLLTDDSWYDDVALGTGWAWDDLPYYYAAPVSALTVAPDTDFDAGNAFVRITPGADEGAPTEVGLEPETGVVHLDNQVTTGAPDSDPSVAVQRENGGDRVVVTGTLPAGGDPVRELTTVADPTAYAGDVFARALAAHGVEVGPTESGQAPPEARVLAEWDSMPLSELLVPFLKLSNNGHAETLVKAMGRASGGSGSWTDGLAVVREKLKELGLDPATINLFDGSGLSAMDSMSARDLATVLDSARDRPWFDAWYESLPVAADPDRMVGGTLRGRMADTPAANNVHAKTGSMTGVTTLAGYVTARDGRPLVFSVLFNDFVSEAPQDLEDAIAVRLAEYDGNSPRSAEAFKHVPKARLPEDNPLTSIDESTLECSWVKGC